jgi:hypothetical protein
MRKDREAQKQREECDAFYRPGAVEIIAHVLKILIQFVGVILIAVLITALLA